MRCAARPPYSTDNLIHNLKVERFFEEKIVNGRKASADGPIKTFPLRGIKDSPPYLHDDRLLTLEDTVEFFNLVLETKLTADEKADLVVFLRCLGQEASTAAFRDRDRRPGSVGLRLARETLIEETDL